MEYELPGYLPFGTAFRVPDLGLAAMTETLRTNTMHRVHSAFELAAVAREETVQTIRRASSFQTLKNLAEQAQTQQEEIVQQSWRLVASMRAVASAMLSFFLFPFAFVRTIASVLIAIMCRPGEGRSIVECAARDARRLNARKEE